MVEEGEEDRPASHSGNGLKKNVKAGAIDVTERKLQEDRLRIPLFHLDDTLWGFATCGGV